MLTEGWMKKGTFLASPLDHSKGNVTGGGGVCLYPSKFSDKAGESL